MNKLIFSIIFCALLVCLVISKESELNKRGISVAGGTDIDYDNQFPHLVSLQYSRDGVKYQHFCGGSVIASRWILTAAHCLSVDGMDVSKVRVLAGVANQDIDCSNPSSKCVIGKVKRKLVHPNYNSQYIRNDIAMLELTSDLPLGTASQNRVQRIGIEGGQIPFKTLVTLTGWGRTSDASNDLPSKAQKAYMPLQQASVCNDQGLGMETPYQLCVGEGNRINSCQGDSGGPLHWIRQSGNSYTMGLIGLVSYGPQGCGRQGAFGVYTNTTYWINYVKNYVPDLQVVYMNGGGGGGATNPTNPSNPSNPGTCNCANNNQEQSIELPKVIKIA